MRYSLKWLLLAMAYVAIVAAAIGSRTDVLADAVWALSLMAICYAVVLACVSKNQRRAMAIGFALLASVNVMCTFSVPTRLPIMRLLNVVGYGADDGSLYGVREQPDPHVPGRVIRVRHLHNKAWFVTANAVGTMLAGLVGCGIGALAYLHSHHDS